MLILRDLIPGYIQNYKPAKIYGESCFKIDFLLRYNVQTMVGKSQVYTI